MAPACSAPPPAASAATSSATSALGTSWPAAQIFPRFAAPAALDVIAVSGRPADIQTLITTLQGIVNRTQPRIYTLDGGAPDQLWLDELHVPTTAVSDPLALVAKYRSEVSGIVIYDDAQPDTLNLATTIAGLQNGIVASPSLASTLTAAPYALAVVADLRANHFASKLDVYQYELDHYAAAASHRLIIGLTPGIAGNLRDYAVATGALMVWLDPRNAAESRLLDRFLSLLPPNSPYLGWWLDEPSGVQAAARHGVPVYAADWSRNLTVLGGSERAPTAPPAPSPPPLQNKIYVAVFMSDGDNLQEDQGLVPLKWADRRRGEVPIGWTVNPALVDVAPVILRYFQRTATGNDVLVSGPSGLGYTYPAAWPSGAFESYTQVSGRYMAAAGLRVATVWNNGVDLADADASAYARNVPNLVGLTIQDASQSLRLIDGRVPLLRLATSYGDDEAALERGIDAQLSGFLPNAPRFIAVQGNMNSGKMNPSTFADVQRHYAGNGNVVFVRPDHFFQLLAASRTSVAHRVFSGDFNGDGKADQLFYYAGNGDWWMALSDGSRLVWHHAGNVAGFGNLNDGAHSFYTGDFNGDGKTDVAFYAQRDGNWWLGLSNGNTLDWRNAGNTAGFGGLADGRHRVFVGDFDRDGKTDVGFYYSGDGNWWIGHSDGKTLAWRGAGNTAGFGGLLDGNHTFFDGDFDGDGRQDVLFYYRGDGNWWLGSSDGGSFRWRGVGNSAGFGDLLDGGHELYTGDFDGDHHTDVLFHYRGDGSWWMGRVGGGGIDWHLASGASGAPGAGDRYDWDHRAIVGDFDGDHRSDVALYTSADGGWRVGHSDGEHLAWRGAGQVGGFGDLLDPSRVLFAGDYDGNGATDVMFYYAGDGNWWGGVGPGDVFDWRLWNNSAGFGDLTR